MVPRVEAIGKDSYPLLPQLLTPDGNMLILETGGLIQRYCHAQ
jgi:hypothetical protein